MLRIVAKSRSPSLQQVTISGPEASGADVLVLAQACKRLSSLVFRGQSSVDSLTHDMLRRKHIHLTLVPPKGA